MDKSKDIAKWLTRFPHFDLNFIVISKMYTINPKDEMFS